MDRMERRGDGEHLWTEWKVSEDADCLNDGKKYRKCELCYSYEYKTIYSKPNKHEWSKWYVYSIDHSTRRDCYVCKKKQVIKLSHFRKDLNIRRSFVLKIKKKPYGDSILKYLSSNNSVASVNKNGKVFAKKKGKTIITVKMESGCKARCTVTVR